VLNTSTTLLTDCVRSQIVPISCLVLPRAITYRITCRSQAVGVKLRQCRWGIETRGVLTEGHPFLDGGPRRPREIITDRRGTSTMPRRDWEWRQPTIQDGAICRKDTHAKLNSTSMTGNAPGNIAIVEQHTILRTVFIPYKNDIVQVILRQIDTPLSKSTSGQDLIAFSKSLCREDSVTPVPLGVPPFRVALVSRGASRHALVVRLFHAQYDGFSVPIIYTDLTAACHGNGLSAATDSSFHMQHRLSQKSTTPYQFWREYLQDSSVAFLDHCALGGNGSTSRLLSMQPRRLLFPPHPQESLWRLLSRPLGPSS
jgi:hypothetical protein